MQRCLRLCRAASIQHTTAHRSELPTARRQRHALMSHVLRSLDTDASRLRVYVHALQKRARRRVRIIWSLQQRTSATAAPCRKAQPYTHGSSTWFSLLDESDENLAGWRFVAVIKTN